MYESSPKWPRSLEASLPASSQLHAVGWERITISDSPSHLDSHGACEGAISQWCCEFSWPACGESESQCSVFARPSLIQPCRFGMQAYWGGQATRVLWGAIIPGTLILACLRHDY